MSEAPPADAPRVDFYVLESASATARLRVACRLAEKAWNAGQRTLVLAADAGELGALDELLWIFSDGSFVPHEIATAGAPAAGAAEAPAAAAPAAGEAHPEDELRAPPPVLLSASAPPGRFDVLINLASALPPSAAIGRIAEIIDADAARRQAGRARFKAWRDLGIAPGTHTIGE